MVKTYNFTGRADLLIDFNEISKITAKELSSLEGVHKRNLEIEYKDGSNTEIMVGVKTYKLIRELAKDNGFIILNMNNEDD